ncbi:hypothetical protein CVT26_013088 [Gymnopilus dilepis]|uniref:Uncharacterized protein n=1 Tax=Gymnopilus dilepis TaxID=231916 RepID=A0A409Y4J5_9AGAR|nr:hypothetical protein CVT26_013088 [Gymnopilus dilepis]
MSPSPGHDPYKIPEAAAQIFNDDGDSNRVEDIDFHATPRQQASFKAPGEGELRTKHEGCKEEKGQDQVLEAVLLFLENSALRSSATGKDSGDSKILQRFINYAAKILSWQAQ